MLSIIIPNGFVISYVFQDDVFKENCSRSIPRCLNRILLLHFDTKFFVVYLYYPHNLQVQRDADRFLADLAHNISRDIVFDVMMRVRTSTG